MAFQVKECQPFVSLHLTETFQWGISVLCLLVPLGPRNTLVIMDV